MAEGSSKLNVGKNVKTFKFVTYQQPGDAKDNEVRAQVRSHVSRWQHQKSRERFYEALISGAEATHCTASSSWRTATRSTQASVAQSTSTHETSNELDNNRPSTSAADFRATCHLPEAYGFATTALARSFSQGTMSFRIIALQDPDNVVGRSLKTLHLELPSVMRLYRNMSERQSLDFIRQYGEGSGFRFYPLVFTDPILLSTAILIGVRNKLDIQERRVEGKPLVGVLHIEQFLIQRINEALGDPVRGITDQMLLAVGLCAAYEIKHGNGVCFHTHMRGLVQMINLRGGLLAIGDPDPYVLRVLFWLDINTSILAGCKPYFDNMADSLEVGLCADPKMFRDKGGMEKSEERTPLAAK